jgi:hypothetical protein
MLMINEVRYSQGDTPEDLLDSARKGLEGVLGLGSGQTHKFCTSIGESSGDEYIAESTEAVLEGARVVPDASAPVLAVKTIRWTTTADQNDGDDHENDDGC